MKIKNIVMRSLGKKPATLMYPDIQKEWKEHTRGRIEIDIDACIFCGICQRKCPTNALAVDRNEKSWAIDRMNCIQCCCCVEVCPKKCLRNEADYTKPSLSKITNCYIATPPDSDMNSDDA